MKVNFRILHVHGSDVELNAFAPPSFSIRDNEAHPWYATLEKLRTRSAEYFPVLAAAEKARANRFLHEQDRERFILGHGMLRTLLGRYLGIAPKDIRFLQGDFGKPFLEGHPVHFNLSDTKDAILVAVAAHPIGADIETMRRRVDHERVAGHYFTPREVAGIAAAADGKQRFLELWTRKEAVLKACGVGLMDDLHSLEVGEAENTMTISHPDFMRMAAPEYHVYTMQTGPDHIISLASETALADIRLYQGLPA